MSDASRIPITSFDQDELFDILSQLVIFSEMQVHTLAVLGQELTITLKLVEASRIELSQKLRSIVDETELYIRSGNQHDADAINNDIISLFFSAYESISEPHLTNRDHSSIIGEIITSMKCQDRAKQQLERVVDSLNIMSVGLDKLTN